MTRTKIICTLGPASKNRETISKLVSKGMNIARINFSHGSHDDIKESISLVREASSETGNPIAILGDLAGPKIRIGELVSPFVTLHNGDELTITTRDVIGTSSLVSTSYHNLVSDVDRGNTILIDDGAIELKVEEVKPEEVRTRVVIGGELKPHKGMNLPGIAVSAPAISAKDIKDIEFAVEEGFDFLALSFVRSPDDVVRAKKLIENYNADIPIIAKIEKEEAVRSFDAVLEQSDGIMIARGDLGVEMASEKVPLIQKRIISACNKAGKPVITATQMLESMIFNARPTRAETSDVANAVIDGSDAVMLSGETAVGNYPVKAVETMKRIIEGVENFWKQAGDLSVIDRIPEKSSVEDAVTAAACRAAQILNARAIVAYTQSGSTAMRLSKYRPKTPVLAITPFESIRRRLSLFWGVRSALVEEVLDTESMVSKAKIIAVQNFRFFDSSKSDIIVITSGTPISVTGTTNMIHVYKIE
ncbi:pyruvate kinase [Candidatus Latescibacterota bacterium]